MPRVGARFRFVFLLTVIALSVAGLQMVPALAANKSPVTINIEVAGSDASSLRKSLLPLAQLGHLTAEQAPSLETVRSVAQSDAKRFTQALNAEGFYAATVEVKTTELDDGYRVDFTITTGARYRITSYEIRYTDLGDDTRPKSPADLDIDTDGSSRGADIVAVEQKILSALKARGYPSAVIAERRAEAQIGKPEAKMVFVTTSGMLASFGPTVWPDELRTRKDYLDTFVPWKQGERFDMDRAAQLRDDLVDTGLFTVVDVQPGTPDAEGKTPVDLTLAERKPRTFAAGLTYSTNFGVGGQTSWQHRNLFRRGQLLGADLNLSQVTQSAKLQYKDPRVLRKTDLLISTTLQNETTPFDAATWDSTVELDYHFTRHLTGKAGTELFFSQSEDTFGHHKSVLIGFPVGVAYNNVNNVLNPTKGLNTAATFVPYLGASDGALSFSQLEATASYHLPFDRNNEWVGALWGKLGASLGAGVAAIPADKRYYAGGAGSVRAYGYRLIGPTDSQNQPIGGRSVLEGGGEFRFPVTDGFGGVVFLEGGAVSPQGLFTFDEGIRYGAGFGVRYYTAIGPVRADFALPLNPRSGIDDAVQFYISLGQAF
ncbi:MAG: autotransporter assembly complex family protein [Alphaproteobacteria bacterium]